MGNTRTSSDTSSECPICRGAGYLRYDVPVGHPKFGELIVCSCKAEQQDARRRRELLEMSSLEAFEHFTFDTFDPNVPGVREAYEACLEYAQNPHGWLFLLGRYGCGKTHLAAAVAQHAMTQQGMTVLFIVVPDLLDQLRAAFAPNSEVTYDAQFFRIRTVGLLVLDDLGTENATPWAQEKLFQIINYRYNNRLATIVTSNRDVDALDGRIASRLLDTQICQQFYIDAPDYRAQGSPLRDRLRSLDPRRRGRSS